MRGAIGYQFLLLLFANLISTAPAMPGAGIDSSTSLIQLNNMHPGFPNITSRFVDLLLRHVRIKYKLIYPPSLFASFCPGSNNDLKSDVRTHWMSVHGTTTILIITYCPSLTLDRNMLGETIGRASFHMSSQLQIYGDRSLLASDDPYFTPEIDGVDCELKMSSQRIPQTQAIPNHLTYQIALNALEGLLTFLYTDNHAFSAVSEIVDPSLTGSMRRIGVVSIKPLGE